MRRQDSLTRVSLALSAVLAFRIYREWDEGPRDPAEPTKIFRTKTVDAMGVVLGLLIADFVRKPRQQLPWTFYAALVLSIVEVGSWLQMAMQPGYELHVDASLPVGGFYFVFVWLSNWMMDRTLVDAKKGMQSGERLAQVVGGGKTE